MPILVSCECGKKLRVGDDKAGKRVRCPGCQEVLVVEADQAASSVKAGSPKPKAPPPKVPQPKTKRPEANGEEIEERRPLKRRQELYDEEDAEERSSRRQEADESDEEEERPRKKKQVAARSSSMLLWLCIGGAAAVAGGVALYIILTSGKGGGPVVQGPNTQDKKKDAKIPVPNPDDTKLPDPKQSGPKMSVEEAKARLTSITNLKLLGLGFHNYESASRHLPQADGFGLIKDRVGPPLSGVSWRAHLLPYLEGDGILRGMFAGKYLEGQKPGTWNHSGLKNVPTLFASPLPGKGQDLWLTPYRVFIGPGAAFERGKTLSLSKDFPDGLSNTLFAVEAPLVPWPKPEELPYDPEQPLPKFGGLFPGGFYALFGDGNVRFIPDTTDEKTLRAMITRNGNEKFEMPESPLMDQDLRLIIAKAEEPVVPGEVKESSFGNATNFYPLDLNNHWTYGVEGRKSVSRIIQSDPMKDGTLAVQEGMPEDQPSLSLKEQVRQDAKGVFKLSMGGKDLTPPFCLLKYPVRIGEKWEGELMSGKEKAAYSCQVTGEETVDVPAGKFKTVRVYMRVHTSNLVCWYAPDVGMVKQSVNPGPGAPLIVLELEKFEPKKKVAPPKYSPEEAKARLTSINNLKQIGLAFHNHESAYRALPPADGGVLKDRTGKTLSGLSWRAHVLPFVEGDAILSGLFAEKYPPASDKAGEEWNRPGLKSVTLPVLRHPRADKGQDDWHTPYRVFVGPGTPFERGKKISLVRFRDGTSNTILAVEAPPVPWTKPEELPYDPKQPLPKLGGIFPDGFHALFADGVVRFIPHTIDEKTLRALITPDGGEIVELPPDLDLRELGGAPPEIRPPEIKIPDIKIGPDGKIDFGELLKPLIVFNKAKYLLPFAEENARYLENRDYEIAKLPKDMRGGMLLMRDAAKVNEWLPANELSLNRACTIYAAIMVQFNDEVRVTEQQLQAFVKQGWKLEAEPFTVKTPEKWDFRVLSRRAQAGPVNMPLPAGLEKYRTQTIFVFKPDIPDFKLDFKLPPDFKIPLPDKLPPLPPDKLPPPKPPEIKIDLPPAGKDGASPETVKTIAQDIAACRQLALIYNSTWSFFNKTPEAKVALWRKAAESGHAPAQWLLGRCYDVGVGSIKQDEKAALLWIERSSDQGFSLAQNSLGSLIVDKKAPGDAVDADKLLRKAAQQGEAMAQLNMADRLEFVNEKESLDWLRKAAEAGHRHAVARMIIKLEKGDLPKDDQAVATLRKKAKDVLGDKEHLLDISLIRADPIGRKMPDLTGVSDKKPFKLSQHQGKVVFVKFGASWCGPCRAMIPQLEKLSKRHQGQPFAIVDIDVDENRLLSDQWQIDFVPHMYLLDRDGVIRYTGVRDAALEEAVDVLMKGAKK